MKSGKLIMAIVIGLVCFILVFVILIQFKTVEETNIAGIETMREKELREALADWKTKYETTKEKLDETNQTIFAYEEKIASNQEATELLQKELEEARRKVGKTQVEGNGIIVTLEDGGKKELDDGTVVTVDVIAGDLIDLVNQLKSAGAEAISINDKRIINMSDIVDIGYSFIRINSENVVSPYVVKAIGDQTYLESALSIKKAGFLDQAKVTGLKVSLEKKNNINIPAYNKEMTFKYAK